MANHEERNDAIDAFLEENAHDVELVFGRFLSGVSDDPRDAALDILFLSLMDAGLRRVAGSLPWDARARGVARLAPDVREGSTRGLDAARSDITGGIFEKMRSLVQTHMADTGLRMRLEGKTRGFRGALRDASETIIREIVELFSNALLAWERTVLDRVAPDDPVFIYDGPVDARNRPFCADVAPRPRAYTRAAVESLNAHPLLHSYVPPNVFTFCGGYNCRHIFLPMTRARAVAQGLEIIEQ